MATLKRWNGTAWRPVGEDSYAAKREVLSVSMAGATAGMALPTTSLSGHALTWTRNPTGQGSTGQINGRGGFWADPSAAPAALYCTAAVASKPRWGKVRGLFLPQSTGTGTMCIAAPSRPDVGTPGALTMSVHYRTNRNNWAFSLWDSANGGEIVLASGAYSPPLIGDPNRPVEYELAFRIDGNTATFRTADGVVQPPVTDSRIGTLGGNYLFAESYNPLATDDVVAILSFEGGDTPPETLFSTPSAGDLAQQLGYRPTKTVNDTLYAARWQPNETLPAGTARLLPIARVGTFKAGGTTGATFDATKWNYPRLTFTGTTAGAPTSDIPGATTGDIYVDSTGAEYTIAS
ncbi:hypothetical protein [Williamsia serinedens]|uniref:Uncharacterized protein n=1 Tax=Williamsia serinedens TaxID=391736 RepID=A0ABT1H8T0_9NOCA|nr:hypothetical protein [Williamsia serinedens]MCP2163122.1 hypothetical protein [Williamsia serinedens]